MAGHNHRHHVHQKELSPCAFGRDDSATTPAIESAKVGYPIACQPACKILTIAVTLHTDILLGQALFKAPSLDFPCSGEVSDVGRLGEDRVFATSRTCGNTTACWVNIPQIAPSKTFSPVNMASEIAARLMANYFAAGVDSACTQSLPMCTPTGRGGHRPLRFKRQHYPSLLRCKQVHIHEQTLLAMRLPLSPTPFRAGLLSCTLEHAQLGWCDQVFLENSLDALFVDFTCSFLCRFFFSTLLVLSFIILQVWGSTKATSKTFSRVLRCPSN